MYVRYRILKKFREAESGDFSYSGESSGTTRILNLDLRSWGLRRKDGLLVRQECLEYVSDFPGDDSDEEAVLQVYDHESQIDERAH